VRRYRVVQWATGNIGTRALREIMRDPRLDLAGVLVYDGAKDGVDAGLLCGEKPVGVKATSDRAAIHALAVDCVSYMPRAFDVDDVVALLAAGTNVVTTCRIPDEARAAVAEACARRGASIYATGSSPGFITDALPMALLSMQRRVDLIEIDEFANLSQRDSPHLLFELMGFGRAPETYDERRASFLVGEFAPALGTLAAAANRPVDDWTCTGAVAVARDTTVLAAGELARGTIAAQRTTIVGRAGDDDVVRFTANWYCTTNVDPAWELRPTGWRVRVHGDAPFDVALPFPVPVEELGSFTPAYTANRPVNAIPYVCAARPGVLTTADLPPITPAGP
jgi:hypothetical protein